MAEGVSAAAPWIDSRQHRGASIQTKMERLAAGLPTCLKAKLPVAAVLGTCDIHCWVLLTGWQHPDFALFTLHLPATGWSTIKAHQQVVFVAWPLWKLCAAGSGTGGGPQPGLALPRRERRSAMTSKCF